MEFESTTPMKETTTQTVGDLKHSVLHLNSFINSTSYVRNDPATNGGELVKIWFASIELSILLRWPKNVYFLLDELCNLEPEH